METPTLELRIYAVDGPKVWPRFAPSHYMTAKYVGHRAWIVATPEGEEVAFLSIIRFPHGHITNAWREHRTVVLPDFQGLGIGARVSDWLGEHIIHDMPDADGNPGRFYSRTVHPRFGAYRNASPKWRATGSNERVGSKPSKSGISATALMRTSFSHEYVGLGAPSRKAPGRSRIELPQAPAQAPQIALSDAQPLPLYAYQETGAHFLRLAGSALLADEMGVGKTAQACAAIVALPVLVACPASVKSVWVRELGMFRPDLRVACPKAGTKNVEAALADMSATDVLVLNYEALPNVSRLAGYGSIALKGCSNCDALSVRTPAKCEREKKAGNLIEWGTVIADEAHRIKEPSSRSTRALWALADGAEHRYALTGTPIANRPDDLWTLMRFVAPKEYPSKTRWVQRYALTEANIWSGFPVPVGFKPETRAEFDRYFLPRFLRRTKAQVLPDLPPKTYMVRDAHMGAKQAKAYRELADSMLTQLDSGVFFTLDPLTQLTRLRQFASAYGEVTDDGGLLLTEPSGKLDVLMEVLEELGDRQAVVFSESKQLLAMASARLDKADMRHTLITGDVPVDMRGAAVDQFQSGGAQFILCTLGAGGEGITLTAADTAVFVQRSFNAVLNMQAEDRIHRIGQEADNVTILDIVTPDTVEERVREVLEGKAAQLEDLVRDKEAIRRWLER